ncbi:hypothetical protein NLJ89_g1682 [Agrocybe chaxingu]|uniref:RecA family profile 1 domain-containing protein n=1 Tax=Agrocybe chaxingu TaxID=84603 RepID=A0A9W8MZL1_9AGAR|nr:hypothetical protein NLJ89_g1682 [Agrocybe chaxingu]
MNLDTPFTEHGLTFSELGLLRKGVVDKIFLADLLSNTVQDIAKKCRASPLEIKRLVEKVLDATPCTHISRLDNLEDESEEKFTTGDTILDTALGGGIRTGLVWEVVGESAAGKTQLALQLSLFVQAPLELGGLSASVCYLVTSGTLPTSRLLQIANANALPSTVCSLDNVHISTTPNVAILERVLRDILPPFIEKQTQGGKPVKLVVIDALGELFHLHNATTTSTLVERSQDIARISAQLHGLASQHRLAVLVLNEVIDVFDRPRRNWDGQGYLPYDTQSRLFNTAEFFGDGRKEASLGLVWANQVNTRIMLSRTGRRRYLSDKELPKRRCIQDDEALVPQADPDETQASLIRRLSVIFSSVTSPMSLDYVVTEAGISALENSVVCATSANDGQGVSAPPPSTGEVVTPRPTEQVPTRTDGDEFEHLWAEGDSYENFDWDALEENLSQAVT